MATTVIGGATITVGLSIERGASQKIQKSLGGDIDGRAIGQRVGEDIGAGTESTVGDAGGKAGDAFGSKFMGAAGIIGLGATLGAGLVGSLESSLDQMNTGAKFASKMGLSVEEAKKYNSEITGIFTAGYGETEAEVSDSFAAILGSVKDARSMTGEQLSGMTKDVLNMSQTFGLSSEEIATSLQSMVGSGLASDFGEATDLLNAGFAKLGPKGEDLADTFREYSGDFKTLGLNGKDALGLIANLTEAGVMNTDVASDGLRELFTRVRNGEKATMDSMKALGLNAEEMQGAFIKGGDSAKDAYGQIITSLNQAGGVVKSDAITNLFGSPGEDFYNSFNKGVNPAVGAALGDISNATETIDANYTNASSTLESFKRTALQGITEVIGGTVIPALMTFSDWFQKEALPKIMPVIDAAKSFVGVLWEWRGVIGPILAGVGTVIGLMEVVRIATVAWTAAQTVLNIALTANPLGIVIVAIGALVAGIIWAYNNVGWFKTGWDGMVSGITYSFGQFLNFLGEAGTNIAGFFTGVVNWGINAGTAIGNFFGGLGAGVGDFFSKSFSFLGEKVSGIMGFLSDIGSKIGNVFGGVVGFVRNVFEIGFQALRGMVNFFISAINAPIKMLNSLKVNVPSWVPVVGGKSFGMNIATIPQFAMGGTIAPQPGGTLGIIAEKGRSETIIDTNLYDAQMKKLDRYINADKASSASSEKAPVNQTFNFTGDKKTAYQMARETRRMYAWES